MSNHIERIINSILRDHNILDTGVSEQIASSIDEVIRYQIKSKLRLDQFAGFALQGLLANPDMSDTSQNNITMIAIEYAKDLADTLHDTNENAH